MVPGRGLGLTTTIMNGTINLLDKISVVLKDGTVANDIVVERIWVNGTYVETASRETEAVIFVRYNGTPVQLDTVGIGCVICANGQAIPNVQSIYVKVRLLSENEGGEYLHLLLIINQELRLEHSHHILQLVQHTMYVHINN